MEKSNNKEFVIKTYTQKELAALYDVTPKTFRRWLKRAKVDIGIRLGNFYLPRQVRLIVEKIGFPFVWLGALLMKLFFGVEVDAQHDDVGQDDDAGKLSKG